MQRNTHYDGSLILCGVLLKVWISPGSIGRRKFLFFFLETNFPLTPKFSFTMKLFLKSFPSLRHNFSNYIFETLYYMRILILIAKTELNNCPETHNRHFLPSAIFSFASLFDLLYTCNRIWRMQAFLKKKYIASNRIR